MAYTSYNTIGKGYDTTRKADPYLSKRLFDLLDQGNGSEVLDVGCGTGNYTLALAKMGLRMTGMDPSEHMLEQAREKTSDITWTIGRAEEIPFGNGCFDGVIATLTTHHWSDLRQGFSEIHRVLKPNGTMVLFTSTPEQMRGYWLCHYFHTIMERSCSVMPTLEATLNGLNDAGFAHVVQEPYSMRPDHQDHFLYSAKDSPERYLDPVFRKGISTFSALSEPTELAEGLAHLAADINNGDWKNIRANYNHELGDYLFIIAER